MTETQVLWTGGWDSTFRILDLVVTRKRVVQPVYLIFSTRKSTQIEIETTERIRKAVEERFPDAGRRILPLKVYRVDDIAPDPGISASFDKIRKANVIGGQYERLARFCLEQAVDGIELSIHKDDKAHAVVNDYVTREFIGGDILIRVGEQYRDTPVSDVFGCFRFPLFDLSKLEMQVAAEEAGFAEVLEHSWFCHVPIGNQACGRCGPCIFTIEEGMARRLPAVARYYRYPLRKSKLMLQKRLSDKTIDSLRFAKRMIFG